MWTFDQPSYFLFLACIPVLAYFKYSWKDRGGRLPFPLGLWGGLRFQPSIPGMRLVMFLSTMALWAAFVLMVVALAGPTLTQQEKIYLNAGADILIVLDESPSMAARDFPPENRFNAAKGVIKRFVEGRENDQIGLVTFGRDAALRVPLTLDYPYLLHRLDSLQIMDLGDGTALGLGLALAALHLENSSAAQKVVIVLTDGVNNAGEIQPSTAAELLRSMGIPLYLIGIGTNAAVPIEFTNPRSGTAYSGTLEGGFQEDFLKSLAVPPLGAYFSAGSSGSLESIFLAIDSRESASKRVKVQVHNKPLYGEFLLAAFACLLGFFLTRKLLLKEIL
ncbi:MAG: VWA domain-containing protein [Spirochaetales bacterium]